MKEHNVGKWNTAKRKLIFEPIVKDFEKKNNFANKSSVFANNLCVYKHNWAYFHSRIFMCPITMGYCSRIISVWEAVWRLPRNCVVSTFGGHALYLLLVFFISAFFFFSSPFLFSSSFLYPFLHFFFSSSASFIPWKNILLV